MIVTVPDIQTVVGQGGAGDDDSGGAGARHHHIECCVQLEQYKQALVTAAIGGEKAIATAVRIQERKATLSRCDTLPSRPSSHGFGEHHSAFFGKTGLLAEGQIDQGTGGPSARITLV